MYIYVHTYIYKMWSVFVSPLFYSFSSDFGLHIFAGDVFLPCFVLVGVKCKLLLNGECRCI